MRYKQLSTWFWIVFSCLFFSFPLPGLAENRIIAVTEVWPPFRIPLSGTGRQYTGIDIDLIEAIEKALDITIEIQRHPFARALEMIKNKEADLISGIAYTDQRAQYISYVPTSYFDVRPVFYTQKGQGKRIQSYPDLYQYSIGYSLHSAYFEPFNSDEKLKKIGVSTEEQLINMVAKGRIDLIIGTNPNIAYDIRRHGFKDKVEQTEYKPQKVTPLYFGLSQKKEIGHLLNKIDRFLKQISEDGRLKQILDRYL